MPLPRFLLFLGVSLLSSVPTVTQQTSVTIQQDPQALMVLRGSISAMGGSVPADSISTGAVVIIAGSDSKSGAIRILTRSFDQSSEQVTTADLTRQLTYSRDSAVLAETNAVNEVLPLELVVTSQTPDFPLPLLAHILATQDSAYSYIGLETLSGATCHHVRTWNTFASQPNLQALSDLTLRDFWIDSSSGLIRKIAYAIRPARGAAPRISMEVSFANYQNVSGVSYPFLISKSFNGTPWMTITVQSVAFNSGLTDAEFPVQ